MVRKVFNIYMIQISEEARVGPLPCCQTFCNFQVRSFDSYCINCSVRIFWMLQQLENFFNVNEKKRGWVILIQ